LQSADPVYGVVAEPLDPNALSSAPDGEELSISQEQRPERGANVFLRFARRIDVMLAALLIVAGVAVFFAVTRNRDSETPAANSTGEYGTVTIPLDEIIAGKNLDLTGAATVTINGPIQLNNGLYVAPTLQPTGAKAGQIYYDKNTNQLAYFNGEEFVFLTASTGDQGGIQTLTGVQSLGGIDGDIAIGGGLGVSGNQLSNSGVLSVQGQNGDVTFTAGAGIVINGTTFSNNGILSIASGSPNMTVSNDGNGNVTLSVTSGAGTITSSGGTVGRIPLFTGSQNIEDSIITQSGLTVTISGDLSVVTGGLTLSNALTVSNGGTGASSLATNGVLIGNGTAAVSSVAAGGAGLCLLSTGGAPTWGACPGGAGVTTLNGLSGAVNIANASAAGSTVTLDDATTSSKGIASFNGTNFTVNSGDVNTVQDIDTGATPTFVGVNTNTITPSGPLTVGISAQTALLQGSTTTITSNGVGNDIILNSAADIELQDNTNVTGSLTTSGDIAVNGGDITSTGALNITPGGTLTIGTAAQTLTLQGGATTSLRATSGANTTTVAFTSPTANTTLNFPALAAGTYTICTTSGNCSGAAATLQSTYDNSSTPEIVLDATRGALTIRDNASAIGANLLEVQNNAGSTTYLAVTSAGIVVTGTATVSSTINSSTGALQTNGTNRIDNSGNAVNIGNVTLSGAISGGTTITGSGNINTTGGAIQTNGTSRIDNGGNLINIADITATGTATIQGGSVTIGASAQAGSITLSDGSSNTGTLQVAALGQDTVYTLPDPGAGTATICLTTGNCAGSGGGVTTGGGTTNRLPKFTGSQSLGDSNISDDGTNVAVSIDVIVQGGDLTVGSTSQAASMVLHDGNGQTTTLQAGNSVGNLTFILPTNTGSADQCLKQSGTGNQLVWQDCDGGAGGSSATLQTAYNNSTNPEITLNSSVGGLTIRDNSTPLGANLFEIQNNAGSTTYLAVTVSGVSVTGTATASGNINTTGGALQTNGTNRIDNSGNAVNIGNITGSGAMTIASIGAGNDITIDGADQFIVQDGAVFNALATFNANIDVGANDIVGTTGDINLSNFDVAGATGNVTAGTYNGQTISSSANFTGDVTVATDLTLTGGDIAVNGGDITSTTGLNITPGGTLTVGAVGEQLILQGDANTTLTATSGGFTSTIGFSGVPAANVTYNFDRAAAAGTYTVCTTIGNCAGSGGGVTTTGGTTGTLPVFTGAQTLGDSLVSQSGGVVSVAGHMNLSAGSEYRINGAQISSANLSNDANLAKLGSSQTFTGNTVAFQNGTNSTNAFNVQNAAGSRVLTVDTSGGQIVLGVASTLDGKLVFNNVSNANTVSIVPGTPTSNRTITLPDSSGIVCLDSGNCAGAGATLQTAYNFSVGGTTPKIKLNSTLLGVDIQDADTTIAANLFNIRASNGAGLGSVMFGVGSGGDVTIQNAANSTAAFRLLTQGGTSVLTGDTQNGAIILGQAGTLSGSLIFQNASNSNTTTIALTTPTSNHTITLPNATGTICLSSGNCSGSGSSNTLQAAYDAGNTITTSNSRDIVFNMADTATDANFLVNLQCDTSCGSNGRFALQDDGVDVFAVSPSGTIAFQPTVASTTAFNMKTTLNNNMFTIDTVNSRVGINLGSSNLPTLFGGEPGLHLNGAFRISGTSGIDAYTTPVGASVAAKINIENQSSLSNFGQIMAMGLTSGSSTSVRALSLFDARTVRHQPTIAVFSPDENTSIGFSWNGSNAMASVQTSDSDNSNTKGVIVQSGNVTVGSNANSGDLQLNTGTVAGTGSKTGDIYLVSGDGVGTNNSSGSVSVDVGVNTGSGTRGTLNVGVTNANSVLIGRTAGTTTLQGGTTTVSGALAANGDTTLGNALADLITVGGTIQGGSPFVFEGATADANELTLAIATLTADRTITLPDATGTVCLQSSASCGFATGTSASYIQNQNASQQSSSNFWISGTGRADTALQAPLFDTASGVALAIGTTNATAINLNQNTTIAAGKTLTVTSAATSLTGATTGDALTVSNSTSTGNVAVFNDNSSAVFTIGDGGVFTAKTTASTSSAFVIQNASSATLFSTDTFNNTVKLVTIGRDNTSTYEAIWLQGSKNGITSLIGGNDSTAAYVANDFSGSLRFNGSGVGWGDFAYFPNGGGNGNNGQFRFSTTGSALNTTPNAKVGVGDLYVNGAIGVATNSPSYSIGLGAGANRTIGVQAQTASNTAGNSLTISSGAGNGTGVGGNLVLQGGAGGATSTGNAGGNINITAGNAGGSGNNNGGNIVLKAGSYTGTGATGTVIVQNATDGDAFTVRNAAGTRNFINVNTSDLILDLGTTGTEASSTTVNIGTSSAQDQYVYIGSTASTSETAIRAGTGDLLLQSNSSVIVQSLTDGADAFNVTDSGGNSILSVNTSSNVVSTDGLQVNGTFAGGGLTDCDASNSKLLYDATTKQFSCGTDKPNVLVRKTSTESVTNTTLQDDNDFQFAVGANEEWAFQIATTFTSNTTADLKVSITAPTGSTCNMQTNNIYNFQNLSLTVCGDNGIIAMTSDGNHEQYIIWGTVATGGTPGSVKFRWAQGASSGTTTEQAGGYMTAYKLTGADLAEAYYTTDKSIMPGDIVKVDGSLPAGVKKTEGAYDAGTIGIVSTQPGMVLGSANEAMGGEKPVLLALSGRIPVKVSLENGPIKPGDYLTTSSTPGVAMKATQPGQMIGKALASFSSENANAQGTVMTFANLTWANPHTGTQSETTLQNSSFGDLNVDSTLTTKDLVVTGKATIGELVVGTMKADSVAVTGNAYVGGDINLQGVGQSRNAITKKFIASKHIPIGAVVIIDPVQDGQVTTTTVMGDRRVLGVALTEGQAGGEVTVAIGGSVQVKTATGASLQGGDLLITSGQEGTVEKSDAPTPGQMMGKALGKNESNGTVWVLISLN